MSGALVLGASAGYLALLFAVAALAERRSAGGRSIIANPWVYALSWAVYCTAWTYFGSVGRAAAGGIWFLPIYLGPTIAMLLAWIVLRKMVRISRSYRITSIADFIASRYGKSPALAAAVTLITVIGILPYIALQLKGVSAGYQLLVGESAVSGRWWQDGALAVTLALAGFTILFGTRHLDLSERHEGLVAAIAVESLVKLGAFLAVGIYVTWGLFDGPADIWRRAQDMPALSALMDLGGGGGQGGFAYSQWFAMTLLSGLSVLLLPRQFQMMVVECVEERHIPRAAWVFSAYLLAINLFVLPVAIGGMLILGPGADAETFIVSLPMSQGAAGLALLAGLGGLSAATGMLIVETVAVSTMVCNDLVMPALLRAGIVGRAGAGAQGRDLTRLLLMIRRAAIIGLLLLGYAYFRLAGNAYALVSIGLISFAAVAQFAPALFGGMWWRGGTATGAMAGLITGFAVWGYTLMLPSMAKSGWLAGDFLDHGLLGLAALRPEALFGLSGLDNITHALFWSMLANVGIYVAVSLARPPNAREASQAVLFVDVFDRDESSARPVFWRGHARIADLDALARRLLGPARADQILRDTARTARKDGIADAAMVDRVERQIAGTIGAASARVMVAAVVEEEPLTPADVMDILEEASQIRSYARALEEKSVSLEAATAELRAANEALTSLDRMKDDFMSSVTHELRTPLTSIRALGELMLDTPDMDDPQRTEFLRIVVAESQRLSRLVNQVLDMARLESGQTDWARADVDMVRLVRDAVGASQGLFRTCGVMVDLDLPRQVPSIRADADRLTQVVVNLLSNAAKFARLKVSVTLVAGPSGMTLRVVDDGPGIDARDHAAVFERFRQLGVPADRPGGTGLGLPISRRIVQHFGGEMWVESTPGRGATFSVRLPYDSRNGGAP